MTNKNGADVIHIYVYVRRRLARIPMKLALLVLLAPLVLLKGQASGDAKQSTSTIVEEGNFPADCLQRIAEDFVPATTSERLAFAATSVIGPSAFLYTAIRAGVNQAEDRPKEWGQGAEGFGRRYGSLYAEEVISQALQHGAEFALHEDNRYLSSGEERLGRRVRYAIASTLLARHEDGSRSLSYSAIGSAVGAAFISRAWQPRSTTSAGDAAVSFGLTMATRAGLNVLRELSPRFFGRILQ